RYLTSLFPVLFFVFFFSSRRRHTRSKRDWSSDVCSSDLACDDSWLKSIKRQFNPARHSNDKYVAPSCCVHRYSRHYHCNDHQQCLSRIEPGNSSPIDSRCEHCLHGTNSYFSSWHFLEFLY